MNGPNLDRIAVMFGIVETSEHEGEAVNAVKMVGRELRKAGMSFSDLIAPSRELAVADEANTALLAEIMELRKELDSLRSRGGGGQWDDVPSGATNINATALWALGLAQRGVVNLTERETDFLGTCSQWHGRLTPRMQDWFIDLIDKIIGRTGYRPRA